MPRSRTDTSGPKIDRSFVADMDAGGEAMEIVRAIIALSRSPRMAVTGEGVETARQLASLQADGCSFIQGFLLGRPMGAHQIDRRGAKPPAAEPPAALTTADNRGEHGRQATVAAC